MKKNIIITLFVILLLFVLTVTASAVGNYGVNLESDGYLSENPFYQKGFYGQCTWYCYGRAYEKGAPLYWGDGIHFGNAIDWYSNASEAGYKCDSVASAGSILVSSDGWVDGVNVGHVMFVESVEGNYAYITEGNYNGIYHEDVIDLTTSRRNWGDGNYLNITGFIHLEFDTVDITQGVYTIHSAWNYNKVIDIAGNSKENNANIQLYDFEHLQNDVQKFRIIDCGDYYNIQSVHSGLWLDVASPASESGQNVKLWCYNDSDDERWVFESAGDGYVYIRNLRGNYLDIAGDSADNHANIQVYGSKASNSQRWKLVSVPEPISITPGVYTIHSAWDNNKVLDIQGDSKESGANIQLYESLNNTVQQFRIKAGDGYYFIQSVYSDKWLDISSPAWVSGQNVQLFGSNSTEDERWIFENAGSGYVYIRNVYGNYLDLKGDSSANNTNVQVYWRKEGNSQRWKLVPVTVNVSFDSNGGGGTMTTQSVTKESSFVLPNCTFTAPGGKQFKAWSIGGTEYAVGTSYTVTGNTTVTAIWEDIPSQVISISLNQPECNLAVGDSVTLVATVLPEDAKDRTVNWSSDTPSVATVDDDGRVTAVAPGTAKITVTALGGENVTASCEVTVSPRVEYQIGTLTVRSTSGETLSTIPTGSFLVTIPVTKLTDSGDAVVVIASYTSDGQYRGLLYVGMKNATKGATVELTLPVDNAEGDIAELKAFAINSFADRTPIGAASVFPSA